MISGNLNLGNLPRNLVEITAKMLCCACVRRPAVLLDENTWQQNTLIVESLINVMAGWVALSVLIADRLSRSLACSPILIQVFVLDVNTWIESNTNHGGMGSPFG